MFEKMIVGTMFFVSATVVFAEPDITTKTDNKEVKSEKQKMTLSNINTNKYIFGKAAEAGNNSNKTSVSPSSKLGNSGNIDSSAIGLKSAIDEQTKNK